MFLILISIPVISASENVTPAVDSANPDMIAHIEQTNLTDKSADLKNEIDSAQNGDEILIDQGTYKIHNVKITKNLTLQGNGNARNIIIDGEKKSSIFLIGSPDVHVTFKNITFINGLTHDFGGAISIKTGNVYVDECIFANNTALSDTNGGAIANYGTKENKGYLFVNNSLFINNHADHDGGAVTTHYANSYIYNCVFINNSACRDGGAVRVSVFAYGNVQDCIFMFNHADEWGGAYYSWSGESNIERCIFMNNTAGTNGGAVMVSGNINLQDSIIVNNNGGETGGSFYIQNPMYDTKTVINVHNNLITNNSSPYGKEIYIHWEREYAYNLYTQFDDNDWGDENPNDSSLIDPDGITPRSKVSRTIMSNLFERLNLNLLDKYEDLLKGYFTENSLNNLKEQFKTPNLNNSQNSNRDVNKISNDYKTAKAENIVKSNADTKNDEANNPPSKTESQLTTTTSTGQVPLGNSTSHGEDEKAYELNETGGSVAKQIRSNIPYLIALTAIVLILLAIGYKRNKRLE